MDPNSDFDDFCRPKTDCRKCKKWLCCSAFLLVPVERIELPTFGLQNRWLKCVGKFAMRSKILSAVVRKSSATRRYALNRGRKGRFDGVGKALRMYDAETPKTPAQGSSHSDMETINPCGLGAARSCLRGLLAGQIVGRLWPLNDLGRIMRHHQRCDRRSSPAFPF